MEKLKEILDQGRDPESVKPGATTNQVSPVSGVTLKDMVLALCEYEFVDIDQLDKDLSYILVDKAKSGSSIFQRIQNLQAQGGIRMYAEVYKWFTETSGLGLMEQAAKAMSPNQAAKEENTSEAIELWEEKMNRLARYGEEYQLSEDFKKVAFRRS